MAFLTHSVLSKPYESILEEHGNPPDESYHAFHKHWSAQHW